MTLALTLLALLPLFSSSTTCCAKGLGAWSVDFFTTDPTGRFLGDPGGIRSAIVGTSIIVALASLSRCRSASRVALYLVEYGKRSAASPTPCATSST